MIHAATIVSFVALLAASEGLQHRSGVEGSGILLVESEPGGASVYVDGRLAGETPLTLRAIAAGVHRVRVLRLGYLENSRIVTIKADTPATVRVRLTSPASQAPNPAALRIVVLEGEGGVNIIQQKTAVAPVIEVRDRNDQPVAGAVVKFAISKGRASFNGARAVTVTADAAGRATAAGLTPTGSGLVQIGATATFQGQTALATIVQTNVLTAAQAAGAATASGVASSSTGATAGGGAAGGGGGLSGTTLGVVAGAAAAGTIVGVRALGGENTASRLYTGRFSGLEILSFGGVFCRTESLTATLKMNLTVTDETVTGTASIDDGSITTTAVSSGCTAFLNRPDAFGLRDASVAGSPGAIAFSKAETNVVPPNPLDPLGTTNTHDYTFTGSLNGSIITGTILHRRIIGGNVAGTATFPVTLQ